jgi:clusterin-associated protein 1
MQSMEQQIQQTQEAIGNIAGNEAQLDQKIEKKTAELQRLRKRLDTMKNIR